MRVINSGAKSKTTSGKYLPLSLIPMAIEHDLIGLGSAETYDDRHR